LEASTLWPDAESPLFIVGAGDRAAAAWMRRTFEPHAHPLARMDPATWNVMRAGALLLGRLDGPAIEAAERAFRRALPGARLAAFSPSGAPRTKVTFFVFEAGADEPSVVVKAMPEPGHADRLLHECEAVERARERLAPVPDVQAALPLPPLCGTWRGADYLVVQDVDPLAAYTGRAPRTVALEWLRRFQAATADGAEPWERQDDAAQLAALDFGWRVGRRDNAEPVAARVQALLAELHGAGVPRCAVHGDYWRGNLAWDGTRLRVYDWEWTRPLGPPFNDIWTYELGDLRDQAAEAPADELDEATRRALDRVEDQLEERGIDRRFALATLAPGIAELSFRVRRATGRPGGNELGAVRVMESVEGLLGLPRRGR
jgi:aminoglycoside phosphotransferase (APT) family kinase protein